jgi:nucleoside triphosphate diphosphatase
LRAANGRFEDRFRHIEARLAEQDRTPAESSLEEMDRFWNEAKEKGIGV